MEKHVWMSSSAMSRNANVLPISLKEVTALSHNWSCAPTELQGASEKQLEKLCNAMMLVLPGCEAWLKDAAFCEGATQKPGMKESLMELAKDLGLEEKDVGHKIEEVWRQLKQGGNQDQLNNSARFSP